MTPLERAARVLARRSCPPGGEAHFPYVSADEWESKNWRDHIRSARAVIEALREPSDAMRVAGGETWPWDDMDQDDVWELMIDAALVDGPLS